MLLKVISGGQTGADIAGLRAARRCNIATGGWAPKGYGTERGPKPYVLGRIYGLREHSSEEYPPRTLENVLAADMTLIIADRWDSGSRLTAKMALRAHKPAMHIGSDDCVTLDSFKEVSSWIVKRPHCIINIAGNRESKSPGLERLAEKFLVELFDFLNNTGPL